MRKKIGLILLVIGLLMIAPMVYGAALSVDSTGSTDVVIGQASETQLTKTTQAQNVTITNIVTDVQTTHWSAFLGNVTANLALTGGESQGIFEFTLNASNLDAVAATTDANFDWGSFQTVSGSDADLAINLSTSAADSVSQAFNTTDTYLGVSGLLTQQLRNSTAIDSNWGTSVGADTASFSSGEMDTLAFIGTLNDGSQIENFMGGTAEYQMIVGVNETDTPGLDVEVTYNFWLVETQN